MLAFRLPLIKFIREERGWHEEMRNNNAFELSSGFDLIGDGTLSSLHSSKG